MGQPQWVVGALAVRREGPALGAVSAMVDDHIVREKALRLAIRTGVAPDLDFVWATQEKEKGNVCFGAFEPSCGRSCRWYDRCKTLASEPLDAQLCTDGRTSKTEAIEDAVALAKRWLPPSVRRVTPPVRKRPPG